MTSQVYLRNEKTLKLSKPYSVIYSSAFIYNPRTIFSLNAYKIGIMHSRRPCKFREIMLSELKKKKKNNLLVNGR